MVRRRSPNGKISPSKYTREYEVHDPLDGEGGKIHMWRTKKKGVEMASGSCQSCYIRSLEAVSDSYREDMLKDMEFKMKHLGCDQVGVLAYPNNPWRIGNEELRRFYKQQGYQEIYMDGWIPWVLRLTGYETWSGYMTKRLP